METTIPSRVRAVLIITLLAVTVIGSARYFFKRQSTSSNGAQPRSIVKNDSKEIATPSTKNQNTTTMPDLSDIQNEQAKALITKYFTEVKPNIDTLRAQIPGGRIVRSADGTINVTPEFAQKWSLAQSEFIKLQQDITNLDGHTYNISYSLSLSQAHVKLFINDKLVTETDTTDSKSVNFRLFASDSFQKYISPENLQGLYILRSGVNHLRVEYTMTPKPVEVSEGSEITNEITPFSLTLNGSTKSYSGSVTPTASDIKDILVLQEKPITITNGVPKTTEGSLSADFTLE